MRPSRSNRQRSAWGERRKKPRKATRPFVGLEGALHQTEGDQNVRAARDLRETIWALENQVEELNEQLDETLMTQSSDAFSRALDQREQDDEGFMAGSLDNKPGRQHSHQTRLDVHKLLARGVAPSSVIGIMNQFGVLNGKVTPALKWINQMRVETRVLKQLLAANAGADPKVLRVMKFFQYPIRMMGVGVEMRLFFASVRKI